MCPLGYHHNDFVATYALGYMIYGYTLLVPMKQRVPKKLNKKCATRHVIIMIAYILRPSYLCEI